MFFKSPSVFNRLLQNIHFHIFYVILNPWGFLEILMAGPWLDIRFRILIRIQAAYNLGAKENENCHENSPKPENSSQALKDSVWGEIWPWVFLGGMAGWPSDFPGIPLLPKLHGCNVQKFYISFTIPNSHVSVRLTLGSHCTATISTPDGYNHYVSQLCKQQEGLVQEPNIKIKLSRNCKSNNRGWRLKRYEDHQRISPTWMRMDESKNKNKNLELATKLGQRQSHYAWKSNYKK